jgi:hypothetical protein
MNEIVGRIALSPSRPTTAHNNSANCCLAVHQTGVSIIKIRNTHSTTWITPIHDPVSAKSCC